MRILIYNFVQPEDARHKQGGGVAIYQGNLTRTLLAAGHEVVSLSAGDRYSLFGSAPRVVFKGGAPERAVILNSPVFAPAHSAFHAIHLYADHPGLDAIPAQLRARYGRLDVLHFQNVEGLTAGFLRAMRRSFPEARMLATAHNYNLVCPQVNLWYREHRACTDFHDGRSCVNCLSTPNLHRFQRNLRRMETILNALGITRDSWLARPARTVLRAPFQARRWLARGAPRPEAGEAPIVILDERRSRDYARYRAVNVELCRDVFDEVLAVSDRTKEVLARHGVPAAQIAVCRIGTAHAARFRAAPRVMEAGDPLRIAFLGYMRADKGFYFLLHALETMPRSWSRRIALTIAAPVRDGHAMDRLRWMADRFHALAVFDGYTHATLDRVLDGVQLGIVPPLWEDNLPQVAIEMVARGIPILTSDRGGAREIADQEGFTFSAGSVADFHHRLHDILTGRQPLSRFWDKPIRLLTMEEHLGELMAHYAPAATSAPARAPASAGARPRAMADVPVLRNSSV